MEMIGIIDTAKVAFVKAFCFNPIWGWVLVGAAILWSIYRHHCRLLRQRWEKAFWAAEDGGGFYRAENGYWQEVKQDADSPQSFREVACTIDHVELLSVDRSRRIQLHAGRSRIQDKGEWTPYREGNWVRPENPILGKSSLKLILDWKSSVCVAPQASGRDVLFVAVVNTSEKPIILVDAGFKVRDRDMFFPFISTWHKEPDNNRLESRTPYGFYVEPEVLALHGFFDRGYKGTTEIQGYCRDTLDKTYYSNSIALDIDRFATVKPATP